LCCLQLAQPIRLLLAFVGQEFEDKYYECGTGFKLADFLIFFSFNSMFDFVAQQSTVTHFGFALWLVDHVTFPTCQCYLVIFVVILSKLHKQT